MTHFHAQAAERIAPPPGIEITASDRQELEESLNKLAEAIQRAEQAVADQPSLHDRMPDVLIFHKAVDWALRHDEFFREEEVDIARKLIELGLDRASHLESGRTPWTQATGLVVRGYRSRVDGSIQPYGLVVPESWSASSPHRHRLDVWLHGRDNHLTDLKFIHQRLNNPGQFTPSDTIVLHPYGRYCNAFKFAGETDVFEAMEEVRQQYRIDERRMAVRGFSMGGAGCWHLAAHHPGVWSAAAPGAGFSETAEYLNVWSRENPPGELEQQLWGLYDATQVALNLFNLPVISYDGDQDQQKQAADMMAAAMAEEGMHLYRVTGRDVGHKYTPEAIEEINERIAAIVAAGKDSVPREVQFQTRTLRYPQSHWVRLERLMEHWRPARVTAHIQGDQSIQIQTENIAAMKLTFGPGESPFAPGRTVEAVIDGSRIPIGKTLSDRSFQVSLHRDSGRWHRGTKPENGLVKKSGLQGPIDDVWFDSFLMVTPTGKGFHSSTSEWIQKELEWMRVNWRSLFRGDARLRPDTELSEEDLARHHLVLWGDPSSNRVLRRIIDRLPVLWNESHVEIGGQSFDSNVHVPLLIYPNPLNPEKYVVLNSGFTFRAFGSNADQTPKLPDYAVIDIRQPATSTAPGGVAMEGFFDEFWELK